MYNYYQQREFENNRAEKNLEDAKKYLQYIYPDARAYRS